MFFLLNVKLKCVYIGSISVLKLMSLSIKIVQPEVMNILIVKLKIYLLNDLNVTGILISFAFKQKSSIFILICSYFSVKKHN